MVPTPRLWILIALGIPFAIVANILGAPHLLWGYNALLLVLAVVTYFLAPSVKGLKVVRTMDAVLSVRATNKIQIEISNDGVEQVIGVLRDEPPPFFEASRKEFPFRLRPGGITTFNYTLRPDERGSDYFRGCYVRQECLFGLVWRHSRLPFAQPVRVYPNLLALREFDLLKQKGRLQQVGIRKSRIKGLGTEFESLREYGEGDDYRKIDWKASGRRGKLVVRQYEQEKNQTVIVAIDVGRHMLAEVDGVRKLDRALDACLMLLHAARTAGDQIGLLVYADRVRRYIPPSKSRGQMSVVIEAIHDLVALPVESDPVRAMSYLGSRHKRRSLLVIFTDTDSPEGAQALAAVLASVRNRHLTLLARVADPSLLRTYDQKLAGPEAFYERAAAGYLVAERRKGAAIINGAGLHNLEAEPDDLASALVNFYFVAKDRAMI